MTPTVIVRLSAASSFILTSGEEIRLAKTPTVRDIANKIVHGDAERVEVSETDVRMYFVNKPAAKEPWTEIWFSVQPFLDLASRALFVSGHSSPARDEGIRDFMSRLNENQFLPTPFE